MHDGFLADSAAKAEALKFNAGSRCGFCRICLELRFHGRPGACGRPLSKWCSPRARRSTTARFNNNGWLQEIPADPITKVTWDNAALLSPATAEKLGIGTDNLGIENNALIEISTEKGKVEVAAIIAPGHADGSISVALGYGRTVTGRVGKEAGFNMYPLRTTAQPYFVTGAQVKATGETYHLALTQEHWAIEGRAGDLTREATLNDYKAAPEFAKTMGMDAHIAPNISLYSHPPLNQPEPADAKEKLENLDPHAWGHGGGYERLHRMFRVHGGLPGGE